MKDVSTRTDSNRFDVEFANRLAHLESFNKHLYRPNTYLHKWWARRCGSTFRLLLKSFVSEAGNRDYYAPGGLAGKIVLDPMLGGGTTLHEAIRLGANVVGYDVDPVPVLQARATLADISLDSLEEAFQGLVEAVQARLAPYYLTSCVQCGETLPVRFILYGLRQQCECGEALVVDSLVIRRERDGGGVRLCDRCGRPVATQEKCDCSGAEDGPRLYEKGVRRCPRCHGRFRDLLTIPYYQRYRPLVIVANCARDGLRFQAISGRGLALLAEADELRARIQFGLSTAVEAGPKSDDLIRRGIEDYADLYSSRQLLYLRSAVDSLSSMESRLQTYLALLVSTSLEFNVMLCGYKGAGVRRAGAIRHAFSHHAYSFPYTAVENNPVYEGLTSGSLRQLFRDRATRARQWAQAPRERALDAEGSNFVTIEGEVDYGTQVNDAALLNSGTRRFHVQQGSAADMALADGSVDYVITDPPYFDSVQYGNLSSFFRVWLRQMLSEEASQDISWSYSLSESAVDSGNGDGDDHYLRTMSAIFAECGRVLKPEDGRLAFTFHHWKAAGWAAITIALKRSEFRLQAYYIVHSENPISVHIANMNALTDDAILILARATGGEARSWREPLSINTASSAEFCRDCAEGVGWLLGSQLGEAELHGWWVERLGAHAGRENK